MSAASLDGDAPSARGLRLVQQAEGVLLCPGDALGRGEVDAEVGPEDGELEQVVPDLPLRVAIQRRAGAAEDLAPSAPDGSAEGQQRPALGPRGQLDAVSEPDAVGQAVQLLGQASPLGEAKLPVQGPGQLGRHGEGLGRRQAVLRRADRLRVPAARAVPAAVVQRGLELPDDLPVDGRGTAQQAPGGQHQDQPNDPPGQGDGVPPEPLPPALAEAAIARPGSRSSGVSAPLNQPTPRVPPHRTARSASVGPATTRVVAGHQQAGACAAGECSSLGRDRRDPQVGQLLAPGAGRGVGGRGPPQHPAASGRGPPTARRPWPGGGPPPVARSRHASGRPACRRISRVAAIPTSDATPRRPAACFRLVAYDRYRHGKVIPRVLCRRWESNPHGSYLPEDFKSSGGTR